MRSSKNVGALLVVIIWLMGLAWLAWESRPDGTWHMWALDVGQGDAILIQTPRGKQILIDGGPSDRVLVGLGQHMPFWDRQIELMIVSHNHADHISGLIDVLERYTVEQVWLAGAIHTTPEYERLLELLKTHDVKTEVVMAGTETVLDETTLAVLYPLMDYTGIRPTNQHDATVVVRAVYGGQAVLLTGDLDEEHETEILTRYCGAEVRPCPALAADVLKVPHHGSRTGLTPDFLAAVRPQIALIPVGERNSYGHPHPLILERLNEDGVSVFRTDKHGDIEVKMAEDAIVVEPEDP